MSAAAVMIFTVGILAQGKPDFSGKWAMQMDPNAQMGGGGGRGGRGGGGRGGVVGGMEFTITQTADNLKVERAQGQNTVTYNIKLDGTESKNTVQGRGGDMDLMSKATWDGGKLSIATTLDFGNGPSTTTQVLSMDGGDLVVETTAPGRGGGDPVTTKTTYKKG